MAINKICGSFKEAVADVFDGATKLIGRFGGISGNPINLIRALREQGAKNLCLVHNNAGYGLSDMGYMVPQGAIYDDHAILVKNGQVKKVIASYPFPHRSSLTSPAKELYQVGKLEVEIVPQGTLAERIRAGGAGIGGFYVRTGVGTPIEEGKEKRVLNGEEYLLELPIRGDFAFIRAHIADTLGNLVYRGTARVFNPVMATAAKITIVEVDKIVEPGALDPEYIVTPAAYVDRIVLISEDKP